MTSFQFAWYFHCPSPVGLCHSSSASQRANWMLDFVPRIITDGPYFCKNLSFYRSLIQPFRKTHTISTENFRVRIFMILSRWGNVTQPFGKKFRFIFLPTMYHHKQRNSCTPILIFTHIVAKILTEFYYYTWFSMKFFLPEYWYYSGFFYYFQDWINCFYSHADWLHTKIIFFVMTTQYSRAF